MNQVTPTAGFNIKSVSADGLKLNVWDIGGNAKIRPYWNQYFENTDVLIYVIDSSDHQRMEEAVNKLMDIIDDDKLKSVPILIFANKQDTKESLKEEEILKYFEGDRLTNRSSHIQLSSGKTGEGVKEGMEWLCKIVKDQ